MENSTTEQQRRRIRPLTLDEVREVYRRFMVKDFPEDERKPLRMIEQALAQDRYLCLGLFDGEEILGYAFFAYTESGGSRDCLFDYLAIREDMRNQGVGTQLLSGLAASLPKANSLILEVENPQMAKSEAERAQRQRRMDFYLRNGLRETGITSQVYGVEYSLLEAPVPRWHTPEEVRGICRRLYRSILPRNLYEKHVLIR